MVRLKVNVQVAIRSVKNVSIPNGAIKSKAHVAADVHADKFQFQLVQLKLTKSNGKIYAASVSIPNGAIKTAAISIKSPNFVRFQFQNGAINNPTWVVLTSRVGIFNSNRFD